MLFLFIYYRCEILKRVVVVKLIWRMNYVVLFLYLCIFIKILRFENGFSRFQIKRSVIFQKHQAKSSFQC